jgi:hypothetical protein
MRSPFAWGSGACALGASALASLTASCLPALQGDIGVSDGIGQQRERHVTDVGLHVKTGFDLLHLTGEPRAAGRPLEVTAGYAGTFFGPLERQGGYLATGVALVPENRPLRLWLGPEIRVQALSGVDQQVGAGVFGRAAGEWFGYSRRRARDEQTTCRDRQHSWPCTVTLPSVRGEAAVGFFVEGGYETFGVAKITTVDAGLTLRLPSVGAGR